MKREYSWALSEIHLGALSYTVGHWLPRGDHDPFDLNAPYQRGSVWEIGQRRALIKSLYQGIPVGAIIVSQLPYRKSAPSYRIVDGKQRIETIRMFYNDEFDVPGWWFRRGHVTEPIPRTVTWSTLTEVAHRYFDMHASMPALQFDPEREYLGRDESGKNLWRYRNDQEILVAEAELYGLVNGGGSPQTEEDMERARELAASLTTGKE